MGTIKSLVAAKLVATRLRRRASSGSDTLPLVRQTWPPRKTTYPDTREFDLVVEDEDGNRNDLIRKRKRSNWQTESLDLTRAGFGNESTRSVFSVEPVVS